MTQSYRPFDSRRSAVIAAATACSLALAACAHPPSPSATASAAAASPQTASSSPNVQSASSSPNVQLFFDEDSSVLSAAAKEKLDNAARLYREGNPVVMYVTGHADSSGSEYPNLLLSGERAKAAKDALVARGIPASRLQLQAMGSSLPRDANNPVPQDNRRVVITWR